MYKKYWIFVTKKKQVESFLLKQEWWGAQKETDVPIGLY